MTTALRCPTCGSTCLKLYGKAIGERVVTWRACDRCGPLLNFHSDARRVADQRPPVKADSTVPDTLGEMMGGKKW